ncbi:MAG: prepilin peptidase [Pseudoclavibacter sp.]
MQAISIALGAILGAVFGSFTNVLIDRIPRKEPLSLPASHCDRCGEPLRWYDNIPIISWLALRGRCRHCRTRIGWRSPAVEALSAMLFALVIVAVDPLGQAGPLHIVSASLQTVALWTLIVVSLAVSVIDWSTHRIPNRILYPGAAVSLAALVAAAIVQADWDALLRLVVGGVALGLFYLALAFVKPGAMGLGDVKLVAYIGAVAAWIGWSALVVALVLPFLIGGVVVIALVLARRVKRKDGIPFGPFITLGGYIAAVYGPQLVARYLGLWGLG